MARPKVYSINLTDDERSKLNIFFVWCQLAGDMRIIMAVCNRIAWIQVILYCLTGMVYHG